MRQKLALLTCVLGREVTGYRMLGMFYVSVVQAVLLYGSDMWVRSPRIGSNLGLFHQRMAHILMGQKPRMGLDGMWLYLLMEEAMAEAGLREVEFYISHHQNKVTQYMATTPIMNLCLAEDICLGKRVSNQ